MPKIPFSTRRYGRYYFRRRVRLLDGKDIHVIVPLSTCDGQEARERVAILTAQFDRVRRTVNAYFEQNQTLDAKTIKALFEAELHDCLSKLIMELHDPSRDPAARVRDYRTMASALDISQRPGTTNELTDAHRQMLAAQGHDEMDIEWVACDLDREWGKDIIADEMMALMAEGLGLQPTDAVVARLKHVHLQAMAEAHRLASHFLDEDVQSACDQEEALLAKRRVNGAPLVERANADRERVEALREDAEAQRRQNEAASQKVEEQRISSEAEIARKQAKISAELEAAAEATRQANADAASAAETKRAAAALMETARSSMVQVTAEREQLERDRARENAQLALLVRAADDGNGLKLRAVGDGFTVASSQLTQSEKGLFDTPWSASITAIARKLAHALETVRQTLLRLADRESTLERERREHQRSVAAYQEAVRAHQDTVRDLDVRIANVSESERQIKQQLDAATEATNAAAAKERQASAAILVQERWMAVIAATASAPDKISVDGSGKVAVAPQLMASMPEPLRSTVQKDAPDWARNIIKARHELGQVRQQTEAAQADWKRKTEAVSAEQRRIEKSRKVLDAITSGQWDASITGDNIIMRPTNDSDPRNVATVKLADLEPSFVRTAQAFMHSVDTTDSVLELQRSLTEERSALAKMQPERASQMAEDQRQTDAKVKKRLGFPPELGEGFGR